MKAWKIVLLVVAFLAAAVSGPLAFVLIGIAMSVSFQLSWEKGEEPGVAYYNGQRIEGRAEFDRLEREGIESAAVAGTLGGIAVELLAIVAWVALLLFFVLGRKGGDPDGGSPQPLRVSSIPVR